MRKKIISSILIFSFFVCNANVFAADSSTSPVPYSDDEFAPWLKDLRRAEIITLGAMPFVTLNVTLGFWALNGFDSSLSPFAAGDSTVSKYTNDQTVGILLTSLGICAAIGISDFLVHFLKTANTTSASRKKKNINIESVKNDPEATRIPPPESFENPTFESSENPDSEKIPAENFTGDYSGDF